MEAVKVRPVLVWIISGWFILGAALAAYSFLKLALGLSSPPPGIEVGAALYLRALIFHSLIVSSVALLLLRKALAIKVFLAAIIFSAVGPLYSLLTGPTAYPSNSTVLIAVAAGLAIYGLVLAYFYKLKRSGYFVS
jgi:hypothetical protein